MFAAAAPFAFGEAHIGLDPADDIDALLLNDTFEPGVLNPGIDQALFSLSSFSPNTLTSGTGVFSPGDILFTDFMGDFSLWAFASDIGLRDDDELNALTVPEPAGWLAAVHPHRRCRLGAGAERLKCETGHPTGRPVSRFLPHCEAEPCFGVAGPSSRLVSGSLRSRPIRTSLP